ncbi:BTB/POZ domain-containing protein At2g46260-like isoform X1 [Phoenix dactylifera]|uniref:BTB/POZ domain-containing protein At2g46260-like isoform X1 n=1 Tax=Phoenix dactylifera TaxID=42345 RepID=A0A8B9AXQ2_PHODC|nr:BTB/POZ domain-containing protein At2g46260-like isoform X1 [Phoenix dactylifera]
MKSEPEAQSLTIQIEASEEEAFSGLLEFIYFSTMSPSSYTEIVNLLMISDEFQAFSCAEVCIRLLEMKIEWALSCCELSARVHELYLRELLIKVEKEQKSKICSDIMSHKDELLQLSFDKIEALFCVDTLKVESEDVVYDFIRAWAQNHYPNTEDRCSAKELHLERLIRFPYLTWQKLEEALQCDIFDQESILKAVNQALAFKVRGPYCRRLAVGGFSNSQFFERCYERTPVMVSRLQSPAFDRCVVYFSLTENELLEMYPVGRRESEDFMFGHQVFSLVSSCKWTRERHYFGLNVTAKGDCSDVIVYVIRFLAMSKVDDREEFQERDRGSLVVANQITFGCDDLLPGIWEQLLSGNCPFLLGGILHLCIEITCHQQDESYDCPIPAMDGFPRPRHDG